MRHIYLFYISILSIFIGTLSCDRIENPVVIHESTLNWSLYPDSDTSTYPWPTWTTNTNTQRNVLLEDYTGHTCVNCPSAGTTAKNIEANNTGKVIVISVHASTTSGYQVPYLPDLPLDHRTEAGNEYANTFDVSSNPLGLINRKRNGNIYTYLSSSWQTEVNNELQKSPDFNIQAQYNYFETTNGLFFHTEVEAINAVSGDFGLINFLIRDTVVAPQEDLGGVLVEDYDHHSMLSANINGIWGTQILTGDLAAGDKLYNNYSYELPDPNVDTTYRVNNISIVSAVFDRDSYEVLQVIKTPLAP